MYLCRLFITNSESNLFKNVEIMGNLLKLFMGYFETLTPEQIQADWDALKEFNDFGAPMLLTIENSQCWVYVNDQFDVNSYVDTTSCSQTYSLAA